MTSYSVAGIDWASEGWLAVICRDGTFDQCILEENFENIWEKNRELDQILVDVPIGLPEDPNTVRRRERVDSAARSVTGKPSSVFPVPSRKAAKIAHQEEAQFEEVVEQNETDIGKGLSWQSYYITAGIGEVDELLRESEAARETIAEAHPEVCFRALLGTQLQHSKDTAAGVGERLRAIGRLHEEPGMLLEEVITELIGKSNEIEVDDVIDSLALALTALQDEIRYLPENCETDLAGLPMRMAYWAEEPLTIED